MAIFKCKMCGGSLEISSGTTVVQCEYCGTKQTLPNLDDEKRANLYDRANHFRRNNEFDKAAALYEQILNEDGKDAEAYWSLILCRYGIEYVEDPVLRRRVPTVNRAQFTSIFDDDNYKSALQYADGYQKSIYEEEAKEINEIQKGILAISQKEEPFDVFICYKETDNNGRRTPDSVLANDLYTQLTQEGLKVFFARITLEDKLGQEYEPIIFAALNSAKVMVALGTKPEHFSAVWVKNEWSRYLSLIRNGAKKTLVPAYKGMDPYDLPEEFSHLQAQDMSKLGFMQDLVRGIKKIIGTDEFKTTVKSSATVDNTDGLLKRAFIFLEDRDWRSADQYLEKVLDSNPENAMAYVGKIMVELQVAKQEELISLANPFEDNGYYVKAMRYADETLRTTLQGYNAIINERIEHARYEAAYHDAKSTMIFAKDEEAYLWAAEKFNAISEYLDSAEMAVKCEELAVVTRKEAIYSEACIEESRGTDGLEDKLIALEKARLKFNKILDYKDSADKASKLKLEIEELGKQIAAQKEKNRKIAIIVSVILGIIVVFLLILFNAIIPSVKYNSAEKCIANKEYSEAMAIYNELGDYRDSADKMVYARYLLADAHLQNKEYEQAYEIFNLSQRYYDCDDKIKESGYGYVKELIKGEKYKEAIEILESIADDEEGADLKNRCYVEGAKKQYENKQYLDAIVWYTKSESYDKTAEFYLDSCYQYGLECIENGDYNVAMNYFTSAGNYKDSKEQIKEAKYQYAKANRDNTNIATYQYLKELKSAGYKDSASIYKELYAWKVTAKINTDPDDSTTDASSISKYDSLYFHFDLQGGEPGGEIKIKYHITYPNGETSSGTWDNKYVSGGLGTWSWEGGIYKNPAFGTTGTFKAKFYDASTGELIGEESIRITG